MVSDSNIALRALHEALVAARNLGLEGRDLAAVTDIVDTLECVPLWIGEPVHDRTIELMETFDGLAARYDCCRVAAATAAGLRRG